VVLYNRGKTANRPLPDESDADYAKRVVDVKTIVGDRKDPAVRGVLRLVCLCVCVTVLSGSEKDNAGRNMKGSTK